MADLLDKDSAWLDEQRTAHMTRPVVYERGADTVEVSATIGRTIFEQVDRMGIVQKLESRDFLVLRTDLVLSGIETVPRAGDRVRDPDGADTQLYEVMAPGGPEESRRSATATRTAARSASTPSTSEAPREAHHEHHRRHR